MARFQKSFIMSMMDNYYYRLGGIHVFIVVYIKTGRLSIDVMSAGKLFQRAGLATGNALAATVERRTGRTRRWLDDEERSDD